MHDPQPAPPFVILTFIKYVVAMNAHTGQRVWQFEAMPTGQLQVEQGRVVFGSGGSEVICLDYLTGALLWRATVPRGLAANSHFLVYAGCVVITGLGEALCLNLQDGAQLWHDPFKGYSAMSGPMAVPGLTELAQLHTWMAPLARTRVASDTSPQSRHSRCASWSASCDRASCTDVSRASTRMPSRGTRPSAAPSRRSAMT